MFLREQFAAVQRVQQTRRAEESAVLFLKKQITAGQQTSVLKENSSLLVSSLVPEEQMDAGQANFLLKMVSSLVFNHITSQSTQLPSSYIYIYFKHLKITT